MSNPLLLLAALALTLTACASTTPEATTTAAGARPNAAPAPHSDASTKVADAAITPLNDLNLVHANIPVALLEAQKAPYLQPVDASCTALAGEVQRLDAVLGPDLDVPASPTNPGLIERGGNAAGNAALGALKGAAEGIVPFRGWVRKLSGAERYSREVAAAIAAGTVRRAFLKGIGHAMKCPATTAPQREAAAS